jgi:flagellar biosynthetic protein FliS
MNAPRAYLETEVATACPPKLRLLLLEAALRLARRSLSSGEKPLPEEVCRDLGSLKKILLHLFTSLERENDEVARNITRVYLFLFCTVAEAELAGETHKIRDVEQVLQIECETWRTLTQRYLAEVDTSRTPLGAATSAVNAYVGAIPAAADPRPSPSRSDAAFDCLT